MALPPIPPRLRRRILALALVALALWLAFFDSHSILRRIQYARQLDNVTEENRELILHNEELERQIEAGLTPERIEKVAREQYGMRRPGETVYRVEASEDE